MGIMSGTNGIPSKSAKKYVLQQSNCNLDVRDEDPKSGDKGAFLLRSEDDFLETENQCSPQKSIKFEAKKLRTIRLDLSSLKRGIVADFSSDDSSEDEAKKKPKPRPVVPNYVTNTDCGPCRKPRQSRQDPLLLSSQNSPKSAKVQPLSIARRNARERNRVKQVNEGFATLRGRIPEYISEAYNEEKGRKSAKKLSKVETLRMAVDYIRHLEGLLDLKSTTEKDSWLKHVKTENPPWDTPTSSAEYPSPRCQAASADSPGTSYDQTFEYQDRIFYEYDLDFMPRKESAAGEKRPAAAFGILTLGVNENENQCVEDFKYYETFNRLKKKKGEEVEENVVEEEEEEREDLKNSDRHSKVHFKDAIKQVSKKTVLPSITESFSKGIPVFF